MKKIMHTIYCCFKKNIIRIEACCDSIIYLSIIDEINRDEGLMMLLYKHGTGRIG